MGNKIEIELDENPVKVRKVLAPNAKLREELKAQRARELAAARANSTRTANIDAIKAMNARTRQQAEDTLDQLNGAKSKQPLNGAAFVQQQVALRKQAELRKRQTQMQSLSEKQLAAQKAALIQKKAQAQLRNAKVRARSQANPTATKQQAAPQVIRNTRPVNGSARKVEQIQPVKLPVQPQPSNIESPVSRNNPVQEAKPVTPPATIPGEKAKTTYTGPGRPSAHEAKQRQAPPIIGATALLAAKYPSYFADTNDHRTKSESRIVFMVSTIILAAITIGWVNWSSINFQAGGDFVYNSGLVGGILMALVLLYAARKRIKLLRNMGNMEGWYYFHLFGGVVGPFLIIFHTSFTLKSINSSVSLITMIIIVLSGVFGRYIYTRIGYRLHRKLISIKETEAELIETIRAYHSPTGDVIERRLSNFALSCLTGPRSIFRLPMRLLAIRGAAATCYVKAADDLTALIRNRARRENWGGEVFKHRVAKEKNMLREHINSVANIANEHLYERLLVKWRILHIPLLYILVITALFHVLAVHMY